MTNSYESEISVNLERAQESIQAAKVLAAAGYFDFAASRAYYTAFYAAIAAILSQGLRFKQHRSVIKAIHKDFVKTGVIEKEYGKNLNWLFELRSIGDYGESRHVLPEEAQEAIVAGEAFLSKIKEILGRS